MQEQKCCGGPDVFVLIAPHFDVTAVVCVLTILRERGITVTLISTNRMLVRGLNGISLQADVELTEANDLISDARHLLVIAGGQEAAAIALADPRTHQLTEHVLAANGYIATLANVHHLVVDTGLLKAEWAERFLQQGSLETAVFVQELID